MFFFFELIMLRASSSMSMNFFYHKLDWKGLKSVFHQVIENIFHPNIDVVFFLHELILLRVSGSMSKDALYLVLTERG